MSDVLDPEDAPTWRPPESVSAKESAPAGTEPSPAEPTEAAPVEDAPQQETPP